VSGYSASAPGRGSRRRRPLRTLLVVVIVLLGLLVAADFAARAVAEEVFASQVQSNGFPRKPSVSIKGFPFLTQLAARNFQQIDLSSANVPEGPVTIKTVNATLNGVHLNSNFKSGTVDRLAGSAFISFPEVSSALQSQAGPLGALVGSAGLTLSSVGNNEVRASVNLVVTSGSATWRITQVSGNELEAQLVGSSGLPSAVLNSVASIKLPLPSLPFNLTIHDVSVTPDGIVGQLDGNNVSFGS
jgi:hypothetical protein